MGFVLKVKKEFAREIRAGWGTVLQAERTGKQPGMCVKMLLEQGVEPGLKSP